MKDNNLQFKEWLRKIPPLSAKTLETLEYQQFSESP